MSRLFLSFMALLGLVFVLISFTRPLDEKADSHSNPATEPQQEPVREVFLLNAPQQCMDAPVCGSTVLPARIIDLVQSGSIYDRRMVEVEGTVIMLKKRASACGRYVYFVLKDREGYHVNVTDYTRKDPYPANRKAKVRGFYRANIHEIQVCQEVKQ